MADTLVARGNQLRLFNREACLWGCKFEPLLIQFLCINDTEFTFNIETPEQWTPYVKSQFYRLYTCLELLVEWQTVYLTRSDATERGVSEFFSLRVAPMVKEQAAVELQWLEHLWDHENLFEIWVVRATED